MIRMNQGQKEKATVVAEICQFIEQVYKCPICGYLSKKEKDVIVHVFEGHRIEQIKYELEYMKASPKQKIEIARKEREQETIKKAE